MKEKVLLAVLVIMTACVYDDLGLRTSPIDSRIIIETREVLGAESRMLTFQCKTEKSYDCANYPIATEKIGNKHLFEITFTGIGEIGVCLTALGPATTVVNLNSVANGTYEIALKMLILRIRASSK